MNVSMIFCPFFRLSIKLNKFEIAPNYIQLAKIWHVIVCWFLCFPLNLPKLNLQLFCSDVQNNFRFSSGRFKERHRNQQTIIFQVLAELNKIWNCLIFIHLCMPHVSGGRFWKKLKAPQWILHNLKVLY